MVEKPKKVFTMYGKYSNVVTYEYRGKEYDVEYSNCFTYCCTPAYIQHRDAQEKIDKAIEAEKQPKKPIEPAEIGLNFFFEQLEN